MYWNQLKTNLSEIAYSVIDKIMRNRSIEPTINGYITPEPLIEDKDFENYFKCSMLISEADRHDLRVRFAQTLKEI